MQIWKRKNLLEQALAQNANMNIILTYLPAKPGYSSKKFAGRAVVAAEIVEALLKYAPQHRVIIYTPKSQRRMYVRHRKYYSSPEKITLWDVNVIRTNIKPNEATIIQCLHTSLREGIQLRWLCGYHPWPILGLTHDLSSRLVYEDLLLAQLEKPSQYDAMICTSKCAQGVMKRLLAQASKVTNFNPKIQLPIIPLGIDLVSFKSCTGLAECSCREPRNSEVTFLYLGRISYTMKADLLPLLTAFARVRKQYPCHLIIAGAVFYPKEKTSLTRIRKHIRDLRLEKDVSIHTNFSSPQRLELLSASDILISPADSLQESFGLVLLEAMAMGLPIIASDWNGYREVVQDSKTGILVETSMPESGLSDISNKQLFEDQWWGYGELSQSVVINPIQLTNAMLTLLENATLRSQMGAAGQDRVRHHFVWEQIIPLYLKLWQNLVKKAIRSPLSEQPISIWYDHCDVFQEHSSCRFSPQSFVVKTNRIHNSDSTITSPPPVLSRQILEGILELIKEPISISDLPYSKHDAIRHIAYLMKHDVAEIVDIIKSKS